MVRFRLSGYFRWLQSEKEVFYVFWWGYGLICFAYAGGFMYFDMAWECLKRNKEYVNDWFLHELKKKPIMVKNHRLLTNGGCWSL